MNIRLKRVPLAYVTGKTGFMGLILQCRPGVLIPRPDTETVCEKAMEFIREGDHIADVCCGSGCIGLSLAKKKNVSADLFDISDEAIVADLFQVLPALETRLRKDKKHIDKRKVRC